MANTFVLREEKDSEDNIRYRVVSTINRPNFGVKVGDIGGFADVESSLEDAATAWIGEDSFVDATSICQGHVSGGAFVTNSSKVGQGSIVSGCACMSNSVVEGWSVITGNTCLLGSKISNSTIIGDSSLTNSTVTDVSDLRDFTAYSCTLTNSNHISLRIKDCTLCFYKSDKVFVTFCGVSYTENGVGAIASALDLSTDEIAIIEAIFKCVDAF